jgi:hypothetical protein
VETDIMAKFPRIQVKAVVSTGIRVKLLCLWCGVVNPNNAITTPCISKAVKNSLKQNKALKFDFVLLAKASLYRYAQNR